MLLEVRAQARGEAGAMQVNDARRVAMRNLGGNTSTTVSFVVEKI